MKLDDLIDQDLLAVGVRPTFYETLGSQPESAKQGQASHPLGGSPKEPQHSESGPESF